MQSAHADPRAKKFILKEWQPSDIIHAKDVGLISVKQDRQKSGMIIFVLQGQTDVTAVPMSVLDFRGLVMDCQFGL